MYLSRNPDYVREEVEKGKSEEWWKTRLYDEEYLEYSGAVSY
jgi:hypothetical protein